MPEAVSAGMPLSWRCLLLALGIRVLLSPLQHTWDSQTWWNVAAQLGGAADPFQGVTQTYEQLRILSDGVRGQGLRLYYEYWAYPPAMLLVWWPVARFWTLLSGPLAISFAAPDALVSLPFPPVLSLALKAPNMLADLVTGSLLARLASPSAGRWYLFNPLVLLAGLWTFDSVMVALLVGGVAAAQRGRWGFSGGLLGLGAAVKFVPGLLVIAVLMWAVRCARRPIAASVTAAATAVVTFAVICFPWRDGVTYVLEFHSARPGGGMSWQAIWGAIAWNFPQTDLSDVNLLTSAQIGTCTLVTVILLATWVAWVRRLDVWESSLVLLLGYLAGSKLVNEVYPLPTLAVASVVLANRRDPQVAHLLWLLWLLPFVFALVNVPGWGFGLAAARSLGTTLETIRDYDYGYVQTYQVGSVILALLGTVFQAACLWGIYLFARGLPRAARGPRSADAAA